jgi:hypothetical protein
MIGWCDEAAVQELSMAKFGSILPGDLLIERRRTGGQRVCLVISKDTTTIKVMAVSPSRGNIPEELLASDLAKFEHVAVKTLLAAAQPGPKPGD